MASLFACAKLSKYVILYYNDAALLHLRLKNAVLKLIADAWITYRITVAK